MSESSNLEYLGGGNLEQVGICMSQTKSRKSPPLGIMHARGQNYRLSQNRIFWLKIT